ncbi:hypothetical protein KSS87_007222, partial [Heliosperma pusillum]
WASKVLVNSNEACLHGRTEVGLPSHVARFTKFTANKEQRASTYNRLLHKFGVCSTMPDSKFFLETQVTELNGSASTEEIFNINLLSSSDVHSIIPVFSNTLAKWRPVRQCNVYHGTPHKPERLHKSDHLLQPALKLFKVSEPSHADDLQTEKPAGDDQNPSSVNQANRSSLSLTVMLSKPILALEFSCLTMNVETPLVISE